MYLNRKKIKGNKNYKPKDYNSNKKNLFNNKNNRKINVNFKDSIKNKNKIEDNENNIPGFYYDKVNNRYFSLKDKEILNQLIKKEQKKEKAKIIENKNLSFFNIIHYSKVKDKIFLQKFINRTKYLKTSKYIDFAYESDKFPNNIYLFYKNKYLLILEYFNENNNISTNISIHDIVNNEFIKKIIIEEFYNDFIILENNLILIDNIVSLSIINNIDDLIEAKSKKINVDIINKFKIRINNLERISMVYKWPFININNNIYYYLIWNNFYYFDLNNKNIKLLKHNNDTLYLQKEELIGNRNKILFKINKVDINKKYHYINFFLKNDKNNKINFYFFTPNGVIHRYKFKNNGIFFLKQIIENDLLFNVPVIKICHYFNDNYLLISNETDIFNFDIKNQTMTRINNLNKKDDDNLDEKRIKYKIKIFEFNKILNCIIYEKNNDYIIIFSLDTFSEIKKFKIDDYKYNILLINNWPKII